VSHRQRSAGQSKYGVLDRLWAGLADLRGVAWLVRRSSRTEVTEILR
jgi:dolichol-phosphate mannosyltransferase